MKVLLLNGSPHAKGCIHRALSEIATQLQKYGIEAEHMHVGNKPLMGCIACRKCRETGYCAFGEDGVNAAIDAFKKADGIVIGSAVHYASATGQIIPFLDRVFYAAGKTFAYKPGAAVVSCRRGGATATFDQLNKYFTISSMPVVSSSYWNMVHGNTPEEVEQDLEGLQVMRVLGDNMAWLLRCIEHAEGTVEKPVKEPKINTNFVR